MDGLLGRAAPDRGCPSGLVCPILLNRGGCLTGLAWLNSAPFASGRRCVDAASRPLDCFGDRRPLARGRDRSSVRGPNPARMVEKLATRHKANFLASAGVGWPRRRATRDLSLLRELYAVRVDLQAGRVPNPGANEPHSSTIKVPISFSCSSMTLWLREIICPGANGWLSRTDSQRFD